MKTILKTAEPMSQYNQSWLSKSSVKEHNIWTKWGLLNYEFALSTSFRGNVRSSSWKRSFTRSEVSSPGWVIWETVGTVIVNTQAIGKIKFTK
jgi:hypothetical protein